MSKNVQDLLKFPGTGIRGLSRGLYLAYLKLSSSLDRICIATPRHSPDILPHVKIRDCPNVTRWVGLFVHQWRNVISVILIFFKIISIALGSIDPDG